MNSSFPCFVVFNYFFYFLNYFTLVKFKNFFKNRMIFKAMSMHHNKVNHLNNYVLAFNRNETVLNYPASLQVYTLFGLVTLKQSWFYLTLLIKYFQYSLLSNNYEEEWVFEYLPFSVRFIFDILWYLLISSWYCFWKKWQMTQSYLWNAN